MKKFVCVILCLIPLAGLVGCGNSEPYRHNHDFSVETVAPTCSKRGYTRYTCKPCGLVTFEYVPALENGGHNYNNCVCIDCGDFLADEAVETNTLLYEKTTDGDGNETYTVTGFTAESEYIKIPSTYNGIPVTQIADKAFFNSFMKHVILPESIVSIGKEAFKYCSGLMSINIPDSVVVIGEEAFWDCHKIKSISLANLTEIRGYTFIGCESLENIEIPEGVKTIGVHALGDCYSLTSITIPVSVTTIYHAAFWQCRSLRDIYYNGTMEQWAAIRKETGEYHNTNEDASWDAYTGNYTVHCSDGQLEKI